MSAPYWSSRDGRVVLHLGDCRDVMAGLADGSVDVVITDPPYSAHVHANAMSVHASAARFAGRRVDLGFVHIDEAVRASCAAAFARVVRRWCLVFSEVEGAHLWRRDLEDAGLDFVRTGAWIRSGAPQISGDRPGVGFEAVTIAHPKGRKRWNGGGRGAVWSHPTSHMSREDRIHTTQKPIKLMRELVALFSDQGELILDPFAGSATTLVAAYEQGRRCIGVELDEKNAEAAAKRLEAMTSQGALFGVAP